MKLTGEICGAHFQVLRQRHLDALVQGSVRSQKTGRIGKLMGNPLAMFSWVRSIWITDFYGQESLFRYLISLPLNLLPGLGTIFFLAYVIRFASNDMLTTDRYNGEDPPPPPPAAGLL